MIKTPLSTVIGGAFWTPGATVIGGNTPTFDQQIQKLFATGEQGFFYDPNDLSTMYQDAAGTIPVTAAGQPVGLLLDKSRWLLTAPLVPQTDTFTFTGTGTTPPSTNSNTSFLGKACVSVTFPQIVSGGYTASRAVGVSHRVESNTFSKYRYKFALSRKLEADERLVVYVTGVAGATRVYLTAATPENVWIDAESTAFVHLSGTNSFTIYAEKTNSPISVYATAFIADVVSIGNHAYQNISAARPILRKNAVTGANYLEFDGSDDFLQTSNIDFTTTDKMSLFAGVRKLSDANTALVVELGDGESYSLNAFALFAPATSGTLKYDLRNMVTASGASTEDIKFNAPNSAVLTGVVTPNEVNKVSLRVNGEAALTTNRGSVGNLIAAPLYIGRRGGTSLPFTGHVYGIIGIGKLVSGGETTAIEKELSKRVGVTLNV